MDLGAIATKEDIDRLGAELAKKISVLQVPPQESKLRLYSFDELATLWNFHHTTLRAILKGLAHVKVGKGIRYRESDLIRFLDTHEISNSAEIKLMMRNSKTVKAKTK